MTFICHLKQARGGGFISMPKPSRKSFPVFSMPAVPTPEMVEIVSQYLEIRAGEDVGIDIVEMLTLAMNAQKGELLEEKDPAVL